MTSVSGMILHQLIEAKIMALKNKPQPYVPGHLTSDEAIADIMQTTGMSRRNAVRWLRKKISDGRINTLTVDQRTMKKVERTPKQVADLLAVQNPEGEH